MATVSFVFQAHMSQELSFIISVFTVFKLMMKVKIVYDDIDKNEETKTY